MFFVSDFIANLLEKRFIAYGFVEHNAAEGQLASEPPGHRPHRAVAVTAQGCLEDRGIKFYISDFQHILYPQNVRLMRQVGLQRENLIFFRSETDKRNQNQSAAGDKQNHPRLI